MQSIQVKIVVSCVLCVISICGAAQDETSAHRDGTTNPPSQDFSGISSGIEAINRRDWDMTISNLTVEISKNPSNALAYEYRGSAWFAKGEWKRAVADYSEVIQIEPRNGRAYFNRASAYRSAGQYERAMDDVSTSLSLRPTDHLAYKLRASLHSFRGEFTQAISDWTAGLRIGPDDSNALACRGADYAQLGRFQEALRDYREAIGLNEKDSLAFNNLAWLRATCPHSEWRDAKEATSAALKACELTDWKKPEWIDTLAAAFAEAGDFEQATAYQEKALSAEGITEDDRREMLERLSLYRQGHEYRTRVSSDARTGKATD